MKTDYQKPDFEFEELGDISREDVIDRLVEKDWTADLMKFTGLVAANKQACPPNINAQIDERIGVTIVPSDIGRFTVIVGKKTGPQWLGLGKDFFIEDIGLQEVESVLAELERGRFEELEKKYST